MQTAGLRSRPIDTANLVRELGTLWRLATDAFADGFLYTPVDEAEFRQMYAPRAAFARPELVRLIERRGEPVGFLFALPDMLQAARGEPVDTVIFKTLAVVRGQHHRGLGNWIVDSMMVQAREMGFRRAVYALMHESNRSRKLGRGRMREIRRYTLYARPL
jgi:GNAT superfamily N-acetyltransferase